MYIGCSKSNNDIFLHVIVGSRDSCLKRIFGLSRLLLLRHSFGTAGWARIRSFRQPAVYAWLMEAMLAFQYAHIIVLFIVFKTD